MKFTPGTSGNPTGRKRGVRNRASALREQLERAGPAVIERVITAAVGGDLAACKMVLDRIVPVVRPIEIQTPPPPVAVRDPVETTRRIEQIFGIVRPERLAAETTPPEAKADIDERIDQIFGIVRRAGHVAVPVAPSVAQEPPAANGENAARPAHSDAPQSIVDAEAARALGDAGEPEVAPAPPPTTTTKPEFGTFRPPRRIW